MNNQPSKKNQKKLLEYLKKINSNEVINLMIINKTIKNGKSDKR